MENFVIRAVHQNDGFEYSWLASKEAFKKISKALDKKKEGQAVLTLVHTCYGTKVVRVVSLEAYDLSIKSVEAERYVVSPLWLTIVGQEEIVNYIPDFFYSDYQNDEDDEPDYPQRVIEEEPFETYTIPNGWSLDQVLSFFREEVAPQYRGETLYFEGIDGNGIKKIVFRESESHNEQNEVAVWDQLHNTLSIGC